MVLISALSHLKRPAGLPRHPRYGGMDASGILLNSIIDGVASETAQLCRAVVHHLSLVDPQSLIG